MYTQESMVIVHPFTRQLDGDEVVIGRPESDIFFAISQDAVEVLDQLAEGRRIGEVADLYQQKYGEKPDIHAFLSLLEKNGIIESGTAAQPAKEAALPSQSAAAYHFSNLSQTVAQRVFSPPVLAASVVVIFLAAVACFRAPFLLPRSGDLYFPDHRALSWTLLTAVSYFALFVHELAHLVAARAIGVRSRIGVSHRLWYLVAETDLTGMWSAPKQKRYLPLIAGAWIDLFSGAVLLLFLLAVQQGSLYLPPPAVRFVRAVLFTYAVRLIWQCFFFVRTDFYYVIANFFNCKNLLADTEVFLRNQLGKMTGIVRVVDQSEIPLYEQRVIRIYAWVYMMGRVAALVIFTCWTVPVAARYVGSVRAAVAAGYAANPANFMDTVLLAGYFLVPLLAGFALWVRGMVRRRMI